MCVLLRMPLFLLGVVLHEALEKILADRDRIGIELGARRRHEVEITFVFSAHQQRGQPMRARHAHVRGDEADAVPDAPV